MHTSSDFLKMHPDWLLDIRLRFELFLGWDSRIMENFGETKGIGEWRELAGERRWGFLSTLYLCQIRGNSMHFMVPTGGK